MEISNKNVILIFTIIIVIILIIAALYFNIGNNLFGASITYGHSWFHHELYPIHR
jgi:hypothetical protein